jgi:hypothetical protein
MSNPRQQPDAPPKRRVVREIVSLTVKYRIGPPNEPDGQLETVTRDRVDMVPAVHEIFGPGVWLRFKVAKGYAEFVPASNIRRVNYQEREE